LEEKRRWRELERLASQTLVDLNVTPRTQAVARFYLGCAILDASRRTRSALDYFDRAVHFSRTARQPTGSVHGTWQLSPGSIAGFRVAEDFYGMSDQVVGRTSAVTGSATVAGGRLTAATFTVDLRKVTVNGRSQPQFEQSLGVAADPDATFTLTEPLSFTSDPTSGAPVTAQAAGNLTLHGITRPVVFTIHGRYTGSTLMAAGAIPVAFSDYSIAGPQGYGALARSRTMA